MFYKEFRHIQLSLSLAEVLDHYINSTETQAGRADLKPINLTDDEKSALIAFLNTLNAEQP